MTELNEKTDKGLRNPKTLYMVLLAVVVLYAVILYAIAPLSGSEPLFPVSASALTILTIAISIIAAYMIINAFILLPRRILKVATQTNVGISGILNTISLLRGGAFAAVATAGLILGIIGAGLAVTVPYFAVAAVSLIITFPTDARMNNMLKAANPEPKDE